MALPVPSDVLTAVARLVAESRGLRDMVTGLATILHQAVPFEQLHGVVGPTPTAAPEPHAKSVTCACALRHQGTT